MRRNDGSDGLPSRVVAKDEVRVMLKRFVRARVQGSEVDDLVQSILCDALAAETYPLHEGELRRWLIGIARHKIADLYRRTGRERPDAEMEASTEPADVETPNLLRWAEAQLGDAAESQRTLEWMVREGHGERLEHIAREESLDAANVRQRVSRMRRLLKRRWLAELAAALGLLTLVWVVGSHTASRRVTPLRVPALSAKAGWPTQHVVHFLRDRARLSCEEGAWARCLVDLDFAADLDPEGATQVGVRALRESARHHLEEDQRRHRKEFSPRKDKPLPRQPAFKPKGGAKAKRVMPVPWDSKLREPWIGSEGADAAPTKGAIGARRGRALLKRAPHSLRLAVSWRLRVIRSVAFGLAFLGMVAATGCGDAELGEECDKTGERSNCVENAICTAETGGKNICRKECKDQGECPTGFNCNGVSGSSVKSCQPDSAPPGT